MSQMTAMNAMNADPRLPGSQAFRDGLGVAASVLCAIHCAAMPFVVGFLPLLGLSFLAEPSFHKWMVGICLGLALIAFVPGWRRHQRLMPALIGLGGLGLISFAAFAGPDECCPTPHDGTTASTECASMGPADPDAASCDAACCETIPTSAVPPTDMVVVEDEQECTASCCSADVEATVSPPTTAMTAAVVPAVETDPPCTVGCCPEDDETIALAGSGGFMSMFWLLMTPIGGVILVVAHLTNHHLTRCQKACCTTDREPHATA